MAETVVSREPNVKLGLISAILVLLIWAGFLVVSRAGAKTALTAGDITALRFMVAGTLTLPFMWHWWPRHLSWRVALLVAVTGPGIFYGMFMYLGLAEITAAYGGVFANGTIPIFTVLLVVLITGIWPGRGQFLSLGLIIVGGVIVGVTGEQASGGNLWLGIALMLAASAVVSTYIFALRHWHISPREALALVNVPNTVVFLPIWFFLMPSGLNAATSSEIALQALYQGLGPGFIAVILFSLSANHLGATGTAAFSAAVPASAALLGVPVLGEVPTVLEWAGIALVSIGLLSFVLTGKR
ncbi:MAG: DMT family transporter [Pseudomonadota bacterium]